MRVKLGPFLQKPCSLEGVPKTTVMTRIIHYTKLHHPFNATVQGPC